ncbi:MAG: hypothetical protein LQ350_003893 [Teloschistes chrysophthalmus]|nr:MAG: hypothetical protein LQ350_003893 [Niorma chrysophthalma]
MTAYTSLGDVWLALGLVVTAIWGSSVVYSLQFGPLAKYPGPRLWAISRIPYVWNLAKGSLTQRTKELHDRYGPVVRIASNELSFIDGKAWQDIYAHGQGRPAFPKNPLWLVLGHNGIRSIVNANDTDHARYRRLVSHAFSEKALKQQEYLLLRYVDLLVSRLTDKADSTEPVVDIVQWLNFTTFDIIGDLALGESFHCLEESRYHRWVSILFAQVKSIAIIISLRFFGLEKPVRMLLPSNLMKKRKEHAELARERIHRRLDKSDADAQRNDFMTYVLRYNDEKGMSVPEIEATFQTIVFAGSETTATALSGIITCLLRNADVYEKLKIEIRGSFTHASEICAERISDLCYLNAVIHEGLRLCPPVPQGMPRVVPVGGAETFVSASGYSSNRSTINFPDHVEDFDPSRWLTTNGAPKHPAAYNPFSLGPRNCVGRNLAWLEMRLILTRLVWHFDLEAVADLARWEEQKTWILWDKQPLKVRISSRSG